MDLKKEYIKLNKFTRPGFKLFAVKGIVIHWTANPGASARNHKIYFGNGAGGRYASAHIFVDKNENLCIIPLNEVAYAANETGKSKIAKFNGNYGYTNGNANGCTIHIEMCVEKDGTISKVVEAKVIQLIIELCKTYGLTEKDVYRHYDITNKSCPTPFIGNLRFSLFKSKIKKGLKTNTVKVPNDKPIKSKPVYFKAMPSTHMIECKTNVGMYKTTEFNDKTKRDTHYEPGDTIRVTALVKSKNGTPRFKTQDGYYVTSNKAYVKKYTPKKKEKVIGKITVLANSLNYYDSPRWNNPTNTVKRGTVLTIVQKVNTAGYEQYKTISGTYISANSKYVKFIKA